MPESSQDTAFVSFAAHDTEIARHICDFLRASGLEVWFDRQGGRESRDEWNAQIPPQISQCGLFIPLISASTQASREGHFRSEWKLAAERAEGIAPGQTFILPIIIDHTPEAGALVPDRFRKAPWTRFPGGATTPEAQTRFLKLCPPRSGLASPETARPFASTTNPASTASPYDRRGLAAVVFTDVVGYSARMQRDETGTMALVKVDFTLMRERCAQHGGDVLNSMGDGLLMCFTSAVQAVACALQIQSEFGARRQTTPPENALEHRIGVHIGDVFRQEAGGIAGDGVNIAARLEGRAPAGGVCISQIVHDTVKGKVPMQAVFIGPESFKSFAEPISIWHVAPENSGPPSRPPIPAPKPAHRWSRTGVTAALAVAAVLAATGTWLGSRRSPPEMAAASPAPKASDRSVAVLPFTNLGDDKADEYFSDGVCEELLTVLQKIPDLRVIAQTSAFSFKGKNATTQEIGAKLDVAMLVEGSVRRVGNAIRISVHLSRAATGKQVWSENYTRERKEDIFSLQREIAQTVVEQLRGQFDGSSANPQARQAIKEEVQAAEKGGTKNTEAYEEYLNGRFGFSQFSGQYSAAIAEKPLAHFRRAVELDPGFALAWAWLARSYVRKGSQAPTVAEGTESFTQARSAADRALALEPRLAEAYCARMEVQCAHDFDWKGAQESLRQALALAPKDADIIASGARMGVVFNQPEKSLEMTQQALALDPLNLRFRLWIGKWRALIAANAGKFDQAEVELKQLLELGRTGASGDLAINYVLQRNFPAAVAAAKEEKIAWQSLMALSVAHWGQGNFAEADAELSQLIAAYPDLCAFEIATVYAYRNEPDKAFDWLERAYRVRDSGLQWLLSDQFLKSLHGDPRWPVFVQKMGLAGEGLK